MIESLLLISLIHTFICFLVKDSVILAKPIGRLRDYLKLKTTDSTSSCKKLIFFTLNYWTECIFCLSTVMSLFHFIVYNNLYVITCPVLTTILYRLAFARAGR